MSATVRRMPSGQFRLSRIAFLTDMQHTDAREIGIGCVAEVRLPGLRAIGIAVRPSVDEKYVRKVGPVGRRILTAPFDFLWPEYKGYFERGEKSALDVFVAAHTSSLSVFAPIQLAVPRQWLLECDYEKLKPSVLERIKIATVDDYYNFLFPPKEGQEVADPSHEERIAA